MTEIIIYAVLGLGGLLAGGSILIPGVVSLARQMGLPAVAVTVIVIAGGTSTPELIVSVAAAIGGSPGIVWGNLIGSNIANIALVLGLGMLVQPVTADVTNNRQLTGLLIVTLLIGGICLTLLKLISVVMFCLRLMEQPLVYGCQIQTGSLMTAKVSRSLMPHLPVLPCRWTGPSWISRLSAGRNHLAGKLGMG